MSKLANFVGFQACWFACVLGAAHGREWLGPIAVALWCALWVARSAAPGREAAALAAATLIGAAVDTLELQLGWLRFAGTPLAGQLAPGWIVALWAVFASTFDSSLRWLTRRRLAFALFGAFGAPLSYWGGARLGALEFGAPLVPALVGIALAWGAALPLAAALGERLRAGRLTAPARPA